MMKTLQHCARLWLVLAVATATATATVSLPPATAHALTCPARIPNCSTGPHPLRPQQVGGGYTGWAYVHGRPDCSAATILCITPGEPQVTAWRRSGNSWTPVTLRRDEQVYVAPLMSGWHWAWSQRVGWVAVDNKHLYVYA